MDLIGRSSYKIPHQPVMAGMNAGTCPVPDKDPDLHYRLGELRAGWKEPYDTRAHGPFLRIRGQDRSD